MAARAPHGTNQPPKVIVKKIYIEGHGGHHGGAWKVAYADFVTAMMAFFLLLWILGATTEKQRKGIADYFAPTLIDTHTLGIGGGALLGGESILSKNKIGPQAGQTSLPQIAIPCGLILFREFAVSALRETVAGKVKLPVTLLAKWKTTLQMVALGCLQLVLLWDGFGLPLEWQPHFQTFAYVLIWLAAVVTVWTGWQYFAKARQKMSQL